MKYCMPKVEWIVFTEEVLLSSPEDDQLFVDWFDEEGEE